MKVKMFSTIISTDDLENKISDWTKELNPKIISVNVNISVLNDYFMDSSPPTICNTWYEYVASIVYESKN